LLDANRIRRRFDHDTRAKVLLIRATNGENHEREDSDSCEHPKEPP
jgi:hypothetical protein